MKNNILKLTLFSAMAVASLTSFGQQDKKVAKAKKNLAEAKQDLKEAKTDSVADYLAFKKEAELDIKENKQKISNLRAKKIENAKEEQAKYDKKVLAIEQKNDELEKRINGSSTTKTSMWTSFKAEFRKDMKNLESSMIEIGIVN
jgi:DNA-binding helix-hairpin-helix protein with protein kinase domain